MATSTRRSLFDTPQRGSAKRRRTTTSRRTMRIPRSLLPEMKQFRVSALSTSTADAATSVIPVVMSQGVTASQFIGSKFRCKRLRVNYDFTDVTPTTGGFRILVYIPKSPNAGSPVGDTIQTVDTDDYTVLYDRRIAGLATDAKVGTFDVTMNVLVEMDKSGFSVERNSLTLLAIADGAGASVRLDVAYALWFTDN